MGIFDRLRSVFSNVSPSACVDEAPAAITAYDAFGRQIEVPRSEWEAKILPGNLAEAHDDPDKLYNAMVMALQDGFIEQLAAPSARLLEIDPNRERAHTVRGIVLLKSGDLDGAEEVLSKYLNASGPSGIVLTNLAKVHDAQGRRALAEETLWRAIELDPNQDNGLLWWCTLQRDKRGDEAAFWEAMRRAASLAGSWRPQLWLAREALDKNDLPRARQYYEHVLKVASDEQEVLMMISGDLGNHRHLEEIIELILPLYDPERHDPWTGMNLLQACLDTNNLAEGETLVHRLFALGNPALKDRLFHYAAEFDKLRASQPRQLVEPAEQIQVEIVPFDRPIWAYGLRNPVWLFASEVDRRDDVVLVPLANVTHNDLRQPTAQREDDLGRLTRSLPLYLMESLYFWTPCRPKMVLPVVRGRGPVVVGAAWTQDQILSFAEGARFAVSGTVNRSGDKLRIELSFWDCVLGRVTENLRYAAALERLGETILQAERDLLDHFAESEVSTVPCERYYRRPGRQELLPHLTCLGQTLMLSLVDNKVISKDALWGERNILEYCLQHALQTPADQVPKIIFTGALIKSHGYGSPVFSEFKRQALELVQQDADRTSPFYRLSPLLLRVVDPELFHLRKADLLQDAGPGYREWLEAITV